jgi:hypothetical protein
MHAKYADVVSTQDVLDYINTLSDDLFPNLPSVAQQAAAE